MAVKLAPAAPRVRGHSEPDPRLAPRTHHRLEWLKRAIAADIPDRAKTLASALAVKWANDQTGQCNPSLRELCAFLGWRKEKAQRAIADLIEGGLLQRVVGNGRGRKSGYMFSAPSNVVPLPSSREVAKGAESARTEREKGSQICASEKPTKGSTDAAKGSQKCPPLYKDEHTLEHTEAGTGCAADDVSDAFDRLWKTYPRPNERDQSLKLFAEKIQQGADPELIISRAPHAAKHKPLGSSEGQYLGLKRWLEQKGWENHVALPGPVLRSAEGEELKDVAMFFASKIREGRYVAPSAISVALAHEIVGRGLATAEQMHRAGFRV